MHGTSDDQGSTLQFSTNSSRIFLQSNLIKYRPQSSQPLIQLHQERICYVLRGGVGAVQKSPLGKGSFVLLLGGKSLPPKWVFYVQILAGIRRPGKRIDRMLVVCRQYSTLSDLNLPLFHPVQPTPISILPPCWLLALGVILRPLAALLWLYKMVWWCLQPGKDLHCQDASFSSTRAPVGLHR